MKANVDEGCMSDAWDGRSLGSSSRRVIPALLLIEDTTKLGVIFGECDLTIGINTSLLISGSPDFAFSKGRCIDMQRHGRRSSRRSMSHLVIAILIGNVCDIVSGGIDLIGSFLEICIISYLPYHSFQDLEPASITRMIVDGGLLTGVPAEQ